MRDALARRISRRLASAVRARSATPIQHTGGAGVQQILAELAITGLQPGDVVEIDAAFTAAANNANSKAGYIYIGANRDAGGSHLAKSASLASATGAFGSARFMVISATEIVYQASDATQQRKTVDLVAGVTVSLELYLASAETAHLAAYNVRVLNR